MPPEHPNQKDFSVNERENEYKVTLTVTGTITTTITASSYEEATDKAAEMAEDDDDYLLALDEVERASYRLQKCRPMYRVTRDGRKMQVSLLEAGDLPRDPDGRGF